MSLLLLFQEDLWEEGTTEEVTFTPSFQDVTDIVPSFQSIDEVAPLIALLEDNAVFTDAARALFDTSEIYDTNEFYEDAIGSGQVPLLEIKA